MTTKATAEQVAVAVAHWYYVEWSPKGAIRAVPVEDAHFRNHCAFKRREPVGYEPVGLCPSLDAALDFIIELKRMKKELWHDEAGVHGGDEGAGVGGSGDGAKHQGLPAARAGDVRSGGSGAGEAGRPGEDDGVAHRTTEGPGVTCG